MRLNTRISSVSPRGRTRSPVITPGNPAGASAALGQVIRDDLDAATPRPGVVARAFAKALGQGMSLWPSTGRTMNRGPHATGLSARSFRAVPARSGRGRFQPWEIINDARNAKGRPYAGLVDSGIYNWRASQSRIQANYRAVQRTWARVSEDILRRLTSAPS